MTKYLITLLGLTMAAQVALASNESELLMGHFTTRGALNIQVRSGGCTSKKQFFIKKENVGEYQRITFVRKQEDPCRAFIPYGEIITFSFEELGLQPGDRFMLGNSETYTYVSRM